ncbi:hypothetical protein CARUB_v10010434mg [Capsella rubella]|uniref:Pectinesterase inhibitor domain-containing protein n=1 Tax=Capsella rubella TaxID=81985 RepID=R0GS39_9BRAS|nr:uncharacterized protein LOC17897034 [Capsella rubella]EOA38591.1 hypothetical protein CARUB_v10010434mg [Capsella rubella]
MKLPSNILSTVLAITLAFSVAEAFLNGKTQQMVNGICKQTTDTKFCNGVLVKNLVTPTPSNKDLMNVTLREAERFSANTYFFISTLLRDAGDEREDLQMCADAYSIVNLAFTNAISFFNQAYYSKIVKVKNKVSTAVGICKTDFTVPGYEINPLIEKNRQTIILVSMENIVCHMVSS